MQPQRFPATPAMVALANAVDDAGCTLVGLTGRNDNQKAATLGNLAKVGYTGLHRAPTTTPSGPAATVPSSRPLHAPARPRCTTIEYKSQTRAHVERTGGYDIVANFGDQFSDLIGGHARPAVKLPNPTYYLP